jgi:hypothetical protein
VGLKEQIRSTNLGFGKTMRRDAWWAQPLFVFIGLSGFIIYSSWAAFQNANYIHGPYLSPMYSPLLFAGGDTGHTPWIGDKPGLWPGWLPWSPALLILWMPAGFRLTCYYYRGAYYKAFWADPPSCAVTEPRKVYHGENSLPLIMQNVHRYFMYLAVVFIFILGYDALLGYHFEDGFGIGVGSLVLTLNVILLGGYTFGCHSLRHLIGGNRNEMSRSPGCLKAYSCVSCLNRKHMFWAWMSLVWVGFTDLYVRLCSMGIWHDYRLF